MFNYTNSTDLRPLTYEQVGQCVRERRMKLLLLDWQYLPAFLKRRAYIESRAYPQNAEVYHCSQDAIGTCLNIVLLHPDFEAVPINQIPPVIQYHKWELAQDVLPIVNAYAAADVAGFMAELPEQFRADIIEWAKQAEVK